MRNRTAKNNNSNCHSKQMKSRCCCSILFFFFSLRSSSRALGQVNNITRCDQLPIVLLQLPVGFLYNPYYVFRSLDPTYNCSYGVTTGPAPYSGSNYTFVIVQGDKVKTMFTLSPKLLNYTISYTTTCDLGQPITYYTMLSNANENGTYICPYVCDDDGVGLKILRCYGNTKEDERKIQETLDLYTPNVPGAENITNTHAGCPATPFCKNNQFLKF